MEYLNQINQSCIALEMQIQQLKSDWGKLTIEQKEAVNARIELLRLKLQDKTFKC